MELITSRDIDFSGNKLFLHIFTKSTLIFTPYGKKDVNGFLDPVRLGDEIY